LYRRAADERALPLSPGAFDRLFELLIGRDVEVTLSGKMARRRFADGDPPLALSIREVTGGLALSATPYALVKGAERAYLARGDALHRLSADMTAQAGEFLYMLHRAEFNMLLSTKDLPAFCGDVLAGARPYTVLSGAIDAIEQYRALPLEVSLYLDYEQPDTAYLDVAFRYGDREFRPYAEDRAARQPVARDRREEARVLAAAARYFPLDDPMGRRAMLRGEDQLFRLVDEGLQALTEVGALYVTDRSRRLSAAPQPRVAVRAALEGGLLSLDVDVGEFPIEELCGALAAYRARRGYHRLRDGRFLRLEGGALGELAALSDGLDLTEKQLSEGRAQLPAYRALYLDRALRDGEAVRFDRDAAFRAAMRGLRGAEDGDFPPPKGLHGALRQYQTTGYQWLRALQSLNFHGILADDMGLGKTVQVIALLLAAYEEGATPPTLIVCPASLVLNWAAELARFAPSLAVRPLLGDNAARARAIESLGDGEVAITSYDLVKRDVERHRAHTYLYLVIDEAQYIKNRFTQNARSVKAIEARHRLALTGTPIENHLGELWSIFDFLMPGYLYSDRKFRDRFETPIVKADDQAARRQLHRLASPFILRRLKRDVLKELPPKTETVLYATMEGEQRRLYLANLAQVRRKVQDELVQAGIERNRIAVLALLTRLRQLCCDPRLCYEDYDGGSAKLELCMEVLREAKAGGHRLLLFSQFTSMLELIRRRMDEQGFRYSVLTGDTPKEERMRLVDAFNQGGDDAFLISLKAGGTGLNLTGADVVVHYDPWWNVAAQNQATDRAHRIGQSRGVQVYQLIAADSVEEKMLALQERKRDLADAVISESSGGEVLKMTAEQLAALLADD
ncbi:MAG: DEAD/DEAH box helicase family protein, partial [Clostridiales bacterium]|nr:DEAD/DEAH box helicase family protein [Clostridiales bacterium]